MDRRALSRHEIAVHGDLMALSLVAALAFPAPVRSQSIEEIGLNIIDLEPIPQATVTAVGAGVRWVRIVVYWRGIELSQGVYDFSFLDTHVDAATGSGLNVLLDFATIPGWANGADPDCDWLIGECTIPPASPTYFGSFVTAVVDRYKDRVSHWEIWNEPEYVAFWNGTTSEFMNLIATPGIASIRSADPLAVVMGPSTFSGLADFQEFTVQMCSLIDKLSIHFYEGGSAAAFAQLDGQFLPWITTNCNKGVWITEMGVDSALAGEIFQAADYVATYAGSVSRTKVEKTYIFHWADGGGYGLVESSLTNFRPKRSYFEVQDYTNSLLGVPNYLVIRDTLASNTTNRSVGSPLNGTTSEVGGKTWSTNTTLVFGANEITTSTGGDTAHVGGVSFNPPLDPAKPVNLVEADFIVNGTVWSAVGFSQSATGGYWGHGQAWVHIGPSGDYAVYADGLTHLLRVGDVPNFSPNGLNRVRVHHNRTENKLSVVINSQLVLVPYDLDALSYTPGLSHAGVHVQTASGTGGGLASFDNFRVFSMPEYIIFADDFEVGTTANWSSTVP